MKVSSQDSLYKREAGTTCDTGPLCFGTIDTRSVINCIFLNSSKFFTDRWLTILPKKFQKFEGANDKKPFCKRACLNSDLAGVSWIDFEEKHQLLTSSKIIELEAPLVNQRQLSAVYNFMVRLKVYLRAD